MLTAKVSELTWRAGCELQPKAAVSVGNDQAISTASGKNGTSAHATGSPPSCTCQPLRAALANSPMEAPSWKPTEPLSEAVRDGKKLASAQYVSVTGS